MTDSTKERRAPKGARLFSLGRLVATPGALAALEENGKGCTEYLEKHVTGNFGDLCDEDIQSNQEAIESGLRILSAYKLPDGTRIWIISDAKLENGLRPCSTLLLPSEY